MVYGHGESRSSPIGVLLREARLTAGFTQQRLAGEAGISLGALRDLEQGRTSSPSWSAVEGLADVLAIDHSRLAELQPSRQVEMRVRSPRMHPSGDGAHARPVGKRSRQAVRIGMLGPLVATRAGVAIALGSARQRAILGLLVLYGPLGVHRDAISDMLWGEHSPSSAVTVVQGYISGLRHLLGPDKLADDRFRLLTLVGTSYHLTADLQLDFSEFTQLTLRAQAADTDGRQDRACPLYEQSLAMWRGDVLADIEVLRNHPAVVEIGNRRDEVVLRYAYAALLTNQPGEVLPHLRGLCAREPLHERAQALLMTALAATGQQAAALRLFEELRRRLDIELGVRPSPMLREEHVRILRQSLQVRGQCHGLEAVRVIQACRGNGRDAAVCGNGA
jgi:DNA-binding SARP family transcriptional activator/DNA-binding XRE family transcriptional regulator